MFSNRPCEAVEIRGDPVKAIGGRDQDMEYSAQLLVRGLLFSCDHAQVLCSSQLTPCRGSHVGLFDLLS